MIKSEKVRLPKGQSYPLKPSALEAFLTNAGIHIETNLARSPGDLFDVHFWPPNDNVPHERLYVRSGSVPIAKASEARRLIEKEMLPALIEWIRGLLAQDLNSPIRREQQYLNLRSFLH